MKDQLMPDEVVTSKIYLIRGKKVLLDSDLAELYNTETKRLKQQVKRNINRFPNHFMFELTKEENEILRSQNVTLRHGEHSKYLPYAFTEHGILMLSNVLKSDRAVEISIRIIDIFVRLRENYTDQTELWLAIEKIKGKLDSQDRSMDIMFRYLDELSERIPNRQEPDSRKMIGYKSYEE
ncbi:ORF6N domain-containing protein [Mucilaginibacter aquaedulcis]|uniref:ORF6N domain-containing protein n=1 Tax=Mucilaginibacter aquaedulcis TaxID=1187081 RepID=UPI0025B628DF|nr:ORF6N domain-containing protein [Mucilaginibacter aquaedulcis]MDN3548980.1 ORF6N domain-containing protein [Mucilaginibacter aquaedulcis]